MTTLEFTEVEAQAIRDRIRSETAAERALTYSPSKPVSYFRDIALARNGDLGAEQRLHQHAKEMREVVPAREAEREKRVRAVGLEVRVNPNRMDGQGGYFSAPVWLIDQFAAAPRPMRVLSRLIPNLPLPRGVSEIKLPRLTTGTTAGTANDGAAVPSQDIIDAAASQPATAIAGQSDVALQVLEQSPAGAHLDFCVFRDLTGSYDAQLERLLIVGSGTGTEFAGILNLTAGAGGVNAVTFTDANPTPPEIVLPLAQAVAAVGNNRLAPPETWLLRTSRWAWLNAFDTSTRPLPLAPLMGFEHALDDAIPATLGATANQDTIIAMRPSDSILLESAQQTGVKLEPLSGTMQARLQLHGYASCVHRQPTGIAKITGTGMVVQSGF